MEETVVLHLHNRVIVSILGTAILGMQSLVEKLIVISEYVLCRINAPCELTITLVGLGVKRNNIINFDLF